MVAQIAKEFNLELLDERASTYTPEDVAGLVNFNENKTKAKFVPLENFPLEDTPLPKGKKGWILFLDEFSAAHREVQASLYKLILDRKVGSKNLHPMVSIVCAGNRKSDKAVANNIGTAMQSRLVWLELHSDLKGWLNYAYDHNFDHKVTSYINYQPDILNNFNPDHSR